MNSPNNDIIDSLENLFDKKIIDLANSLDNESAIKWHDFFNSPDSDEKIAKMSQEEYEEQRLMYVALVVWNFKQFEVKRNILIENGGTEKEIIEYDAKTNAEIRTIAKTMEDILPINRKN
tara:strand:+ start:900 stop:1259 length:360 start_codon:yes stop_codon:yes gene_type:complete